MRFDSPVDFAEALRSREVRDLLPTNMSSAQLARLEKSIRDFAHLSARTTNENLLQRQMDVIAQLLAPRNQEPGVEHIVDRAAARLALKDMLKEIGYDPSTDPNRPYPGSIKDLSSDRRINLIIDTNVNQAVAIGGLAADQEYLEESPAYEFYRLTDPKGNRRPWADRWQTAGNASGREINDGWGFFGGGRMIALKNHPIWDRLGDPAIFSDALGNAFPPFAFSSGMWWRDVSRAEAIDIGLMQATDSAPAPVLVQFQERMA